MNKIFAVFLVFLMGFFLFSALAYLKAYDFSAQRVSNKMIEKSVIPDNTSQSTIEFGVTTNAEEGSANMVTSIVVGYRAFDTLGEIFILFLASLGVGAIAKELKLSKSKEVPASFILKIGTGFILPLILTFGAYLFLHGHLTPGGGFPGGAIISIGILLVYQAFPGFRFNLKLFTWGEGFAGVLVMAAGFTGLVLYGSFFTNFLNTGVVGKLFSAGIVPILYTLIGLKVGSELGSILIHFKGRDIDEHI